MRKLLLLILSLCASVSNAKMPSTYPKQYPANSDYITWNLCYSKEYMLNQKQAYGYPDNVKSLNYRDVWICFFDKDGKILTRLEKREFGSNLDTTSAYTYHNSKNKIAATVKLSYGRNAIIEWNSDSLPTKVEIGGSQKWTFSYVNKNLLKISDFFSDGVLVQRDSFIYHADGSATDYQKKEYGGDTLTFDKYGTVVKKQCSYPEDNFDATSDIKYTFNPDGTPKSVFSLKARIERNFEDPNEVKKRDDNEAGVVYTYY